MHDSGAIWPSPPDWREALLDKPGLKARALGLSQHLVSGDLLAWSREAGFPESDVGGFGLAVGDRYNIRLARDRILAVGPSQFSTAPSWRREGFVSTVLSAGLLVFEISGPSLPEVIARATTRDPSKVSPSAAISFAGAHAIVYRHGDLGTLRLHVDRPMGSYLWSWLVEVLDDISRAEERAP